MTIFNMAELYRKSQEVKNDNNREEVLIGEMPKLKPYLPIGKATGVIDKVDVVKGDSWAYLKITVSFSLKDREIPVKINKNIFINRRVNSEFVETMKVLVDDYTLGQQISSRKLEGLVVDVEINHNSREDGKFSEISKIYGVHKPTLETFEI